MVDQSPKKGKITPKKEHRPDVGFDGMVKSNKNRHKRRKTKFKAERKRRRAQRKQNIAKGVHR